jgi:RecA-family ATPase
MHKKILTARSTKTKQMLNSNSSLEHNLNFLINVQSSESQTQWKGQSCRYSSQNQNLHQTTEVLWG